MGKKLLIVESPAKAKTIGKYLGEKFKVMSSIGHIRDLPGDDKAIAVKEDGDGKWTFKPTYEISPGKTKVVAELRKATKESDEIYLASDPDREGEAIAWHLKTVLEGSAGGKPFKRVTYNEITKDAVLKAVAQPRDINMPLVDAQQARRILDRIVGYKVSPLLWKNIRCANNHSLSAGRVQSVALRLLVERQKEIDSFKPQTYWLMGVEAAKSQSGGDDIFPAKLARIDGKKREITEKVVVDAILLDLAGATLEVAELKAQPRTRRPLPPFTTSTMQQAASSVLAFSPGRTMRIAQSLYERGLITYMRTDSVNLSESARAAAKEFICREYGVQYYPANPNYYKSKADSQEAHEAIRPTNAAATPSSLGLDGAELKLYDLIWRRFMASQMAEAKTTMRTATLEARKSGIAHKYEFSATTTDIDFDGFLKVMHLPAKSKTEEDGDDSDEVPRLPPLSKGETIEARRWIADEKQTKGPSHYSEASLVKALEENGVGRPSTYAATIETLKDREYAKSEKRKLVPLERGILVSNWLTEKLDSIFNVGYTAQMESELDKVESGGTTMNAMLSSFYGKFMADIAACAEAGVDDKRLDAVFGLLANVKEWTAPRTVNGRKYDDKAFVESVQRQRIAGRKISERQFGFLVRMVRQYASQIPGAVKALDTMGQSSRNEAARERADPELVKLCFNIVSRLGGMESSRFIKSLLDQYEHGRELSVRQLTVLARTISEHCDALDDADAIREKLSRILPAETEQSRQSDPAVPELLEAFKAVREWREPARRGKKVFDDKEFIESLAAQFASQHALSERQNAALRRVAAIYSSQLPSYETLVEKFGLDAAQSRAGRKTSRGATARRKSRKTKG